MKVIVIVFSIVLLAMGGGAQAQSQFSVGQKYRNLIEIEKNGAEMQVPLPPGEWVVSAVNNLPPDSSGSRKVTAYLFNVENKKLKGGVIVFVPYDNHWSGWKTPKQCSKSNYFHSGEKALYAGTQVDCWVVSHYRMTGKGIGASSESLKYVSNLGLKIPINTVYARYYRADYSEYLSVAYIVNPEADGMSKPENSGSWNTSDYHVDRLHQYPKKQRYMVDFYKWADKWKKYVDLGFEGKLSLDVILDAKKFEPAKFIKTVQPNKSQSVKARLAKIKDLLNKGLITEDEAKAKRAKILSEL